MKTMREIAEVVKGFGGKTGTTRLF